MEDSLQRLSSFEGFQFLLQNSDESVLNIEWKLLTFFKWISLSQSDSLSQSGVGSWKDDVQEPNLIRLMKEGKLIADSL